MAHHITTVLHDAVRHWIQGTDVVLMATAPEDVPTLQAMWWDLRQHLSRHELHRLHFLQHSPGDMRAVARLLQEAFLAVVFNRAGISLAVAHNTPFLALCCESTCVTVADAVRNADGVFFVSDLRSGTPLVEVGRVLASTKSRNISTSATLVQQLMEARLREFVSNLSVCGTSGTCK